MVKLLALDLDGTLFDDRKRVPASAAAALRSASEAGVSIALCSGRNHADARFTAKLLGVPAWSITANGAYLGHTVTGTLRMHPLDAEKAARIIRLCYDFHAAPCIYTPLSEYNDSGYLSIARASARKGQLQLRNPDKPETEVPDPAAWPGILTRENGKIMKCIAFLPDTARFPAFRAALEAEGGLAVATSAMFGGLVTSVEINREGVSKGRALACLQRYLGITSEETLCFGDSENDLSMLPNGRFIAMGNASPEIRSQAFAVTGSNNGDGIAEALERFLEIPRQL